jgi:hypothetical protein
MSFPVFVDLRTAVNDGKIWFKSYQFFFRFRTNEHVGDKVLLPGHFMDETDLLSANGVGTTVSIKDIGCGSCVKVGDALVVQFIEDFRAGGLIDTVPINVLLRLGSSVLDHPLVLGRSARVLACIDRKGIAIVCLGYDTLLVGLLVFEKLGVGQVAIQGAGAGDTKLVQANLFAGIRSDDSLGNLVSVTGFRGSSKLWDCTFPCLLLGLGLGSLELIMR